jgi:hypothetical protein
MVLMMQHRTEAYVIEPVGIFFHYGTPGWGTELPNYKAPEWKARGEWARREADKSGGDALLRQTPDAAPLRNG